MDGVSNKDTRVKIVYYSGTGGTTRVAEFFAKSLRENECVVSIQPLTVGATICKEKHDLLVVIFPVHAFNAPEAVYKWIAGAEKVLEIPAAVISVSGGGEVTPNTACRVGCIKKLEKRGYKVVYEEMIVMPSNWIVPTKEPLALMLLDMLPKKTKKAVDNILSGVHRRTKPLVFDRFLSLMGEVEKIGARSFGKRIKVSDACNSCGWCAKSCPAGNIDMNLGKPIFKNGCHLCLRCIYGCPKRALTPGILKFVVLKEGYSLNELEKKLPYQEYVNVEEIAKGYLWSGVRKYFSD